MDFPSMSYGPSDTTERDIKSFFLFFVSLGENKIVGFRSYVCGESNPRPFVPLPNSLQ